MSSLSRSCQTKARYNRQKMRRTRYNGTVTPLKDRRRDLYEIKFNHISDDEVILEMEEKSLTEPEDLE